SLGLRVCQYQEVEGSLAISDWDVIIVQVKSTHRIELHERRPYVVILDEVNVIMRQMSSRIHVRESENALRDLLKSAIHVVAIDAFTNDSTIAFLKQYRDNDIRIFDNKYQPRIGKTVKILYNPDKCSEAMRRGLKMLREGKCVAFAITSCKKARVLANQASALQKPDGSPILTSVYFGQMDGMQRQEDFTNINATWSSLDCVIYTSTVEAGISFEIPNHFDAIIGISNIKTGPNRNLILAGLSALRPIDLPTAVKGHRKWDKIADCYAFDASSAVETYIEAEYQRRLSAKYFPEILCSLVSSTGASLEIISAEDTIANRKIVSNIIKTIEENIKYSDAELIANAPDIIPDDAYDHSMII
ncbi:11467_t:CDS:2, partial [Funneliformis geosporum]